MKNTTFRNQLRLDMHLTEHFTLAEMVRSGVAMKLYIDNTPTEADIERLRLLCQHVLEPLRRRFGAIRITSGYRSQRLNRAICGAKHSQHLRGEAADIHVSNAEVGLKMFRFLRDETDFDQLLFEHRMRNGCRWLHVSYRSAELNRHHAVENYWC